MDKIPIGQVCKIGVGVFIGYMLNKIIASKCNKSKQKSQQLKKQEEQNTKQLQQLKQLQNILKQKSANFEIQYTDDKNYLTKQCLLNFLHEITDILDHNQIIKITQENRHARREVFSELDEKFQDYFKFVCTLDSNVKYMLEKAQKDFALFLNTSFEKILQSCEYHVSVEIQQEDVESFRLSIVQALVNIRQSFGSHMPLYRQPIPKSKLLQIIKYQSQVLIQKLQFLIELVKHLGLTTLQQKQALPLFLTCYIEDCTWNQYKIQSQQMSILSEELDEDDKLKQKFNEFKKQRQFVLKNIHESIPENFLIENQY